MKLDNNQYMGMAINEAYEGIVNGHGGPFGCVIVNRNGDVVGMGHNKVLVRHDPTCHGEIVAIRDACQNLDTHDLSGCTMYTTAEPCPMCKGAALWANIEKVYYGCNTKDTDSIGFRDDKFYADWNDNSIMKEVGREQCLKLFSDYVGQEHELY